MSPFVKLDDRDFDWGLSLLDRAHDRDFPAYPTREELELQVKLLQPGDEVTAEFHEDAYYLSSPRGRYLVSGTVRAAQLKAGVALFVGGDLLVTSDGDVVQELVRLEVHGRAS